ncbi:MAG: hypothetical protein K8W52_30155, partial [Deltaproteobacteria bacterium]|nr:hypothetical protein [Deltaproteobacteria bacterium]
PLPRPAPSRSPIEPLARPAPVASKPASSAAAMNPPRAAKPTRTAAAPAAPVAARATIAPAPLPRASAITPIENARLARGTSSPTPRSMPGLPPPDERPVRTTGPLPLPPPEDTTRTRAVSLSDADTSVNLSPLPRVTARRVR